MKLFKNFKNAGSLVSTISLIVLLLVKTDVIPKNDNYHDYIVIGTAILVLCGISNNPETDGFDVVNLAKEIYKKFFGRGIK